MAKRILIVDDEPYIVMMLRSRLEHLGYEIEEAFNGQEAYDRASKHSYDLMLLDFLMPDMGGHEVCRRIRRNDRLKNLPVIMITAFSTKSRASFQRGGANDVIFKPIDPEELRTKILQHIA